MSHKTSVAVTHPDKTPAQIADEQIRCYQLRLLGHTLHQIADIMTANGFPMTYSTVDRRIKAEIKLRVEPLADQVRQMEMDRLDYYLTKLEPKIEQGDDKAVHAAIRIMERRAKMLGLDAPERVNLALTTNDGTVDEWMISSAETEPDDGDVIEGEVIDG